MVDRVSSVDFSRDVLGARYLALKNWADENNLQLIPEDYSEVQYAPGYFQGFFWTKFKIKPSKTRDNASVIAAFPCTGCNGTIAVGQIYCETCDRFIVCNECRLMGLRLYGTPGESHAGACPYCSIPCGSDTCSNRMTRAEGFDRCGTCEPRAACGYCSKVALVAQLKTGTDRDGKEYHVCPSCVGLVCAECNTLDSTTVDRKFGKEKLHICDTCAQAHYDRERAKFEKWEQHELPISGSLLIPSSTTRPTRTVSIETEFDGDGVAVGKALCSSGLLPVPDRDRYSTQGESGGRYPCLLKSDGSVTGGELVTYLLDLDTENHAAALQRVTEVLRGCREMGQAQFTHRAGGHIHIDLHEFGVQDLWAYYTVFKFLEAPIFYLAGAGAEFGHRSLQGSGYSPVGPEGPFGSPEGFATKVLAQSQRWALHFSNYWHSRGACSCGANLTGNLKGCTCNRGKATAEWRVFNAEIEPRILHGWLALIQAITAYAFEKEDFNESDFPGLTWYATAFNKLTTAQKDKVKERLEWIHRELPLTIHERDSLIYAAKRSQLIGLGESYLDSLLDVQANNTFATKKKPRNPNSRASTKFALAGVSAAIDVNYVDDFYQGEDDDEYYEDDDF